MNKWSKNNGKCVCTIYLALAQVIAHTTLVLSKSPFKDPSRNKNIVSRHFLCGSFADILEDFFRRAKKSPR